MDRRSLVNEKSYNGIFFTCFFSMVWADSLLLKYVRVALMKIPYIWSNADLIISLAYVVLIGLSVMSVVNAVYIKELAYIALMYAVFFLHFFVFKLNEAYFYYNNNVAITECFPMFLMGICVYRINREQNLKVMYVISLITVYFYMLYMLYLGKSDNSVVRGGDMNAAYNLLPHVCLVCAGALRKANPWNVIATIVGGVTILFLGNRGSLLCLGLFVIVTILFSGKLILIFN